VNTAIADLISEIDRFPGVYPIPDGFTRSGFVGMNVQEEAVWWFEFIAKQLPKGHWLLPGNTARKENDASE
jgi:hypothetical protein